MNKCIVCGSEPDPIDYTSVTEYYSNADQCGYIDCSNDKCCLSVNIGFDADNKPMNIEEALVYAWNAVNQ